MANELIKWKNSENYWGYVSKGFHWIGAIFVLGMLCFGFYMINFAEPASRPELIGMHKSFGVLFLIFLLSRYLWRLNSVVPTIPYNNFYKLSKLSAPILYVCMFIMPLSGFLRSQTAGYPVSIFGWVTLPTIVPKAPQLSEVFSYIHGLTALTLCLLILIHAGAAFYHQFVMRDQLLKRMWVFGCLKK